MFTSSRSMRGTREKSRRQRSRSREFCAMKPLEVAAYFAVSEALANVAKYADATLAEVRVADDDDGASIVVEVVDDGVGGADPARGSGLVGLVDRVESLDGTFAVESPPGGGTRIRATIPTAPRVVPL